MTVAGGQTRRGRETRVLDAPPFRAAKFIVVALGVVYALSTLLPFQERPAFLDTWFYSIVLVCTIGLALARPLFVARHRAAWTCIGLAVTAWSVGDIYWSAAFSTVDAQAIPVPSLADIFYVAMYPLAYAGFIMLARSAVHRLPASVWLDGIVLTGRRRGLLCVGAGRGTLLGRRLRFCRNADQPCVSDRDTRALLKAISNPIPIGGVPVEVELSAGVAIGPEHATTPADLVKCAQDALRTAKPTGPKWSSMTRRCTSPTSST